MITIKKHILLTIALLATATIGYGQNLSDGTVSADTLKTPVEAVNDSTFVLEASSIRGRYSHNYFVSPSTNFIKIMGSEIVIQTSNPHSIGYNGLGGITVNGTINKYQLNDTKNGTRVWIEMSSATLGMTTINLSTNKYGNATATISAAFGGRATFNGNIYPAEQTLNFEGNALF